MVINKEENIVGTRIGLFDVLYEKTDERKDGCRVYRVKCSVCGNEFDRIKYRIGIAEICNHQKWDNPRIGRIFRGMKSRCCDESAKDYKRYGGRGITICSEWLENPKLFEEWSLANGYNDDLTIDRINGKLGYCPDNCRWSTYKENSNNRDIVRHIEVNGVVRSGCDWSNVLNLPSGYINNVCRKYNEEIAKELIRRRMENPTLKTIKGIGWLQTYGIVGPTPKPNSGTKIPIRQLKDGVIIAEYDSFKTAQELSKISQDTIRSHSRSGTPDIYGYTWEYVQKQENA